MHFDRNPGPFTCSCKRRGGGGGDLNDFKFGIFIGRFQNDEEASMAANALMVSYLHDSFHSKLLYNLRTEYLSCSCAFQIFVSIVNGRPGVFQPSRVLLVSHVLKWFSIPVVMVFWETVVEAKASSCCCCRCLCCLCGRLLASCPVYILLLCLCATTRSIFFFKFVCTSLLNFSLEIRDHLTWV